MTKQYEINTIKDIFDTIPDDRFEAFLAQLPEGLRQIKMACNVMQATADAEGIAIEAPPALGRLIWVDDGKPGLSGLTVSLVHQGEVLHSEAIKL